MAITRALLPKQLQAGAPDITLTGDQSHRGTYTQRRRNQMAYAYGGIAGLDGRKRYGIGSWFQENIKDPIERTIRGVDQSVLDAESQARVDRQEAGLPEGESYTPWYEQLLKGETGNPLADKYISDFIQGSPTMGGLTQFLPFGQTAVSDEETGTLPFGLDFIGNIDPRLKPYLRYVTKAAVPGRDEIPARYETSPPYGDTVLVPGTGIPAQPEQAAEYGVRVNPLYPIGAGLAAGLYQSRQPRDELPMDQTSINIPQTAAAALADPNLRFKPVQAAQGGRIGAQEGGLMDLGGMEKDYREEGGFVPIGGEEKADDVPARLSKNEFVFTADAVRNAGDGDIDEGAAVMERLMKHLEAGGTVSEDSQGLEGAREMFARTQQLEKRII